jgi:hypothetical protein
MLAPIAKKNFSAPRPSPHGFAPSPTEGNLIEIQDLLRLGALPTHDSASQLAHPPPGVRIVDTD